MNTTTSLLKGFAATCSIAAALAIAPAHATNTLQTTGWLVGSGEAFDLYDNGLTINNVPTGGFKGKWNGTPITFWCAELTEYFSLGGTYNNYTAGAYNNSLLAGLFQIAFSAADDSASNSAAFQLAVWEILFEDVGTLNVSSGDFRVTYDHGNGAAVTQANTWLASLPAASNYSVFMLSAPGNQNFITGQIPPSTCCNNVPEPTVLSLLGAAGIAALVRRRRKDRANGTEAATTRVQHKA